MARKKQIAQKPETTIVEVYVRDLKRIKTLRVAKDFRNNRDTIAAILDAAEKPARKAVAA